MISGQLANLRGAPVLLEALASVAQGGHTRGLPHHHLGHGGAFQSIQF